MITKKKAAAVHVKNTILTRTRYTSAAVRLLRCLYIYTDHVNYVLTIALVSPKYTAVCHYTVARDENGEKAPR